MVGWDLVDDLDFDNVALRFGYTLPGETNFVRNVELSGQYVTELDERLYEVHISYRGVQSAVSCPGIEQLVFAEVVPPQLRPAQPPVPNAALEVSDGVFLFRAW